MIELPIMLVHDEYVKYPELRHGMLYIDFDSEYYKTKTQRELIAMAKRE